MRLSFFQKTPEKESFVALVVTDAAVMASIWSPENGSVTVRAHSAVISYEGSTDAALLEAADAALESLGTQAVKITKVLLGLPETWVNGQTIAQTKKHTLKELTQQLNLQSVGFVVTTEAIIAHMVQEHGSVSAVVLFLEQAALTAHVVINGTVQQQTKVGRTGQIIDDLTEAVSRMKETALPPKMIVASLLDDPAALQTTKQHIMEHTWDTQLFSHAPSVEVKTPQDIATAVAIAGGSEVAKSLGVMGTTPQGTPQPASGTFAFQPVGQEQPVSSMDQEEAVVHRVQAVPRVRFSWLRNPRVMIGVGSVVLLLLLVGAGAIFARQSIHTDVEIVLRTQPIQVTQSFVVDAAAMASDPGQGILKASLRSVEVTTEAEQATTGKKIIGDKAKGKVVIFNQTPELKTFPAGTQVVLNAKVKFILDEEVRIASKSTDALYNTTSGKASVSVTAADIGDAFNLGKDVELTVGTFDKSAFVAKTETEVTGGNSRQIQAVSEGDTVGLIKKLEEESKAKAKEQLQLQALPTERIIISDTVEITGKDFSSEVGAEAQTIALKMTAKASGIVYTQEDLQVFVGDALMAQAPGAATLKPDSISLDITKQQAIDDDTVGIEATVSAQAVPALDKEQLKKLLAGKTLEDAQQFLKSQQSVASHRVIFSPSFAAALFPSVPVDLDRITIRTTVE